MILKSLRRTWYILQNNTTAEHVVYLNYLEMMNGHSQRNATLLVLRAILWIRDCLAALSHLHRCIAQVLAYCSHSSHFCVAGDAIYETQGKKLNNLLFRRQDLIMQPKQLGRSTKETNQHMSHPDVLRRNQISDDHSKKSSVSSAVFTVDETAICRLHSC
jgi:hypothetical protein